MTEYLLILKLYQSEDEEVPAYVSRFESCWRRIFRVLGEYQIPPDFLKKDKFVGLLHESIRNKVELKDPGSYDETVKIAHEQWKKKMRKEELAKKETLA